MKTNQYNNRSSKRNESEFENKYFSDRGGLIRPSSSRMGAGLEDSGNPVNGRKNSQSNVLQNNRSSINTAANQVINS